MANTTMMFPNTVREFMEQHKMVDTEQIYSNGIEYVPIFRMEQWFAHQADIPRWIPCSERMPKDRQRVLVQFINGFITLIDFHAEGLTNHIEAWMPLPTPYKGGEEE